MESKINYTVVGFFVITLSILAVITGFWLTAARSHKAYTIYQVYMNESVGGLSEQAPVKFNGVQVGYISKIELNYKNMQQSHLLLAIEEDVPITTSTVATLHSQGITGVTYLGLKAQTPDAPLLQKKPGERYPEIKAGPSFLLQIDITIREVANKLKEASNAISRLLDTENLKNIKATLDNIQKASEELPSTVQRISQASAQVTNAMAQTKNTLHNLSAPSVELIQRLEGTASNLEQLTNELKQNPSMLLRGKQSEPLGPGESKEDYR